MDGLIIISYMKFRLEVLLIILKINIQFYNICFTRQLLDNQIHTIEKGSFDDMVSMERL